MYFNRSDLQQFTDQYIDALNAERVRDILKQMRQDLITTHDRLGQNPGNSSAPPSTRKPWERDSEDANKKKQDLADESAQKAEQKASPSIEFQDPNDNEKNPQPDSDHPEQKKRKPGKQLGAPGFGRTQKLAITEIQVHKPICCKGCDKTFELNEPFQATCG